LSSRLQRAKDILARYVNISEAAHESLYSFRKNNIRPTSDSLAEANFDLNETNLLRNAAMADRDIEKRNLEYLEENDASQSLLTEAQRSASISN
jgi:hypothetical protein